MKVKAIKVIVILVLLGLLWQQIEWAKEDLLRASPSAMLRVKAWREREGDKKQTKGKEDLLEIHYEQNTWPYCTVKSACDIHSRPAATISSVGKEIKRELKIYISLFDEDIGKGVPSYYTIHLTALGIRKDDNLTIEAAPIGREVALAKPDIDFSLRLMARLLRDEYGLQTMKPEDYILEIYEYKEAIESAAAPASVKPPPPPIPTTALSSI